MNVWKFSSRWSDTGTPESSILSIFRKYAIVFAYNIKPDGQSSFNIEQKVKEGDLIAIADGFNIVAIGKALSNAKAIDGFIEPYFEQDIIKNYCGDPDVIAVKIKLIDLSEKDRFYYQKMGRFHALHNEKNNKVNKLWENQTKNFSINAKTVTLKYNNQSENAIIFENGAKYIIPIYQRPYSWTEDQIKKFVSDIFISYWGIDKQIIEEPMFIGTMQLSEKKLIHTNKFEQEVIDGQQRLSTFLILLKVLSLKFPNCEELKNIRVL